MDKRKNNKTERRAYEFLRTRKILAMKSRFNHLVITEAKFVQHMLVLIKMTISMRKRLQRRLHNVKNLLEEEKGMLGITLRELKQVNRNDIFC